jgi:aminobenzoyl-glutamate utilization protein A
MKNYAEKVIKGSAEIHGNDYSIVQMGDAENADSDDELMRKVYNIAKTHNIFPELREQKVHFGGSEDFTHMMKRVSEKGGKASYLLLGSRLKGNHHTVNFDFDESILISGVKILSLIALELVENEEM